MSVEVRDAEKRKGLSKYYAYSVEVELNNGTKYFIFRRYKEFHDLNQRLEDRFPVDAGYFNKEERTLPELPKKIIFGRSAVRNVAEQRLPILDTYMRVSSFRVRLNIKLCISTLRVFVLAARSQ